MNPLQTLSAAAKQRDDLRALGAAVEQLRTGLQASPEDAQQLAALAGSGPRLSSVRLVLGRAC